MLSKIIIIWAIEATRNARGDSGATLLGLDKIKRERNYSTSERRTSNEMWIVISIIQAKKSENFRFSFNLNERFTIQLKS